MRVIIIVNPISGASKQEARLRRLVRRLHAAGIQAERQLTTGPGSARRLAAEATQRADAVIAAGGDGTACEIADGLAGSTTPLLVWPGGTENLVAKSLGYRADPNHMVQSVLHGTDKVIDLGTANGRSFVVVAGVGFDAEVVARVTWLRRRMRSGHITHLTYFWPIWRTFWEHRWPVLDVEADTPEGPFAWRGRGMIFVGNMPRYSLGLPVVRDAVPDDGWLDVIIMRCQNISDLLGHAARTTVAMHVEHRAAIYRRIRRVSVRSTERASIQIDGDLAGRLPLEINVRPAALHVRVPPASVQRRSPLR